MHQNVCPSLRHVTRTGNTDNHRAPAPLTCTESRSWPSSFSVPATVWTKVQAPGVPVASGMKGSADVGDMVPNDAKNWVGAAVGASLFGIAGVGPVMEKESEKR